MLAPAAVAPIASIVVISELPMLSIAVMQERVATPSTCTVHAPPSAMSQPNFVPVMPSTSRNTQSNGVSPSTSTLCAVPLTLIEKAMTFSPLINDDQARRTLSPGPQHAQQDERTCSINGFATDVHIPFRYSIRSFLSESLSCK